MKTKKIQYAPGVVLGAQIERRMTATRSSGLTARVMAERYVDMCRACLPYFSYNEWSVIMRAVRLLNPEINSNASEWLCRIAGVVVTNPEINVMLTGEEGRLFVRRLRSLRVTEAIAVLDKVEQEFVKGYDAS